MRVAVLAYYRALDRRAFGDAWEMLTPAVRAGFGGFATWRAGFAQTVSSRPRELAVSVDGGRATATHRLEARDRAACGVAVRHFTMRWELERTQTGWRAVALRGTAAGAALC